MRRAAAGPLHVHPQNPRYFTDGSGRAVYLTGAHTWNNLVDMGPSDPPPAFDFGAYLDLLERYNHNFIRLWAWELADSTWEGTHFVAPQPWERAGPSEALDGKPRFDLARFNEAYFTRLRERVVAAGARGMYVSVMLFEGWELQFAAEPWKGHPFHRENNVNGVDGDPDGDGKGLETHTLEIPGVVTVQEAYVRRAVDAVNDLDNVLYEISNESGGCSTAWHYHMIDFIKECERTRPKQHPVGMTFQYEGGRNSALFESRADWISPNPEGGYKDSPPAADGSKVILSDTDHLWGIGGDRAWVWKTFTRGMNPLFMDPYDASIYKDYDGKEEVRLALGHTRSYAERVDLAAMTPRDSLASSGYCLAEPGAEYLVYLPEGGSVTVDLSACAGAMKVEWFDPAAGAASDGGTTASGAGRTFDAPFGGDAVLYVSRAEG